MKPDGVDEEDPTMSAAVQFARGQSIARQVCAFEGHVADPIEVDEHDQVPCLRCGQWIYVD